MWSTIVGTLFLLARAAHALQNVTVDDDNESIVYGGHWVSHKDLSSNLYYGGSIRLSNSSSSNVTFTFTGVAVYYMSPKWPFEVNSLVSIDSQPAVTVDLTDNSVLPRDFERGKNASSPSVVVWSATGLSDSTHTVLITRDDNDDGMIIVDGFVYSASDKLEAIATTPPATPPTTDSSAMDALNSTTFGLPASQLPPKLNTTKILLAVLGSTVPFSMMSTVASVLYLRHRRKKKRLEAEAANTPQNNISQTTVGGMERGRGGSASSSVSRAKAKARARDLSLYALGNYSEMNQPLSTVRGERRKRSDHEQRPSSSSRNYSNSNSNSNSTANPNMAANPNSTVNPNSTINPNSQSRRPSEPRRHRDRSSYHYHTGNSPSGPSSSGRATQSARSSRHFVPTEPLPASSRQSRHSTHSESETTLPSDTIRGVPDVKTVFPPRS